MKTLLMQLKNIQGQEVFCKKAVLKNFAKFTGNHLCRSFFIKKVADHRPAALLKKRLQHRCFRVGFTKILRIHLKLIFGNLIRCSALRLWMGCFIYFKFTPVFFSMDVFSSVKEINNSLKEINSRLLSKGMLNINLKVAIEKKWLTQSFGDLEFPS